MALTEFDKARITILMGSFLHERRPPKEMRDKVDIAYRMEGQSIIIYEIRPSRKDTDKKIESNIAKATYVKGQKIWRVFWQRSNLKWHGYEPSPQVDDFDDFLALVNEDAHSCFWG